MPLSSHPIAGFLLSLGLRLAFVLSLPVLAVILVGQGNPLQTVIFASFQEPEANLPSRLYLLDVETGLQRRFKNPAISPVFCCPTWSPDGRWIVFSNEIIPGGPQIYIVRPNGSSLRQITDNLMGYFNPAWSPDGKKIAYVSSGGIIYYTSLDDNQKHAAAGHWVIDPLVAIESQLSWSPDGNWIVFDNKIFGEEKYTLYRVNIQDGRIEQLSATDGFPHVAAFSPRDMRLVYLSRHDGNREIYTMAADGSDERRLTNEPAEDYWLAWSADGTRIAFLSRSSDGTAVSIVDADTGKVHLVMQTSSLILYLNWSGDGQRLVYEVYPPNGRSWEGELYTINVDGSDERRLTFNNYQEVFPEWHP
jgi:TolB protein